MDQIERQNYIHLPTLWKFSIWITTIVSGISAAIYLQRQYHLAGRTEDGVFVAILLINSFVAGAFGAYLHVKSVELFELLPSDKHKSHPAEQIFGSFQNILFGFGFSSLLSCSVFFLSPWNSQSLNELLCLYIFCVNFQIGMGAGALLKFWKLSARSVNLMEIRIFNLSRPDIVLFLQMISRTVLLVGFLCSAGVTSLLFSKFELNFAVILFSFVSLTLVILSYLIPLAPFSFKLKTIKFQELDKLEKKLDICYKLTLSDAEKVSDVDKLLTFRSVIRKIRVIPPNGQFSILAAFSATFLSFLPTLVQHFLNFYPS